MQFQEVCRIQKIPLFSGDRKLHNQIAMSARLLLLLFSAAAFGIPAQALALHTHQTNVVAEYGYRYYAPDRGRWVSRDPAGEQGSSNLYSLVKNSAVKDVDLFGLVTVDNRSWGGAGGPEGCPYVNSGIYWKKVISLLATDALSAYGHPAPARESSKISDDFQRQIGFMESGAYQGDISVSSYWTGWTKGVESCRWRGRMTIVLNVLYFTNYIRPKSDFNSDPGTSPAGRQPDYFPNSTPPPTNPVNPELPTNDPMVPPEASNGQGMRAWKESLQKNFEFEIEPKNVNGRKATGSERDTDQPEGELHFRFDSGK